MEFEMLEVYNVSEEGIVLLSDDDEVYVISLNLLRIFSEYESEEFEDLVSEVFTRFHGKRIKCRERENGHAVGFCNSYESRTISNGSNEADGKS